MVRVIVLILILCGCQQSKVPQYEPPPQPGQDATTPEWADLRIDVPGWSDFGEPRASLVAMAHTLVSEDPKCKADEIRQVADYSGATTLRLRAKTACSFDLWIGIGENAADAPGGVNAMYQTDPPIRISPPDMATGAFGHAPQFARTAAGEKAGFSAEWVSASPEGGSDDEGDDGDEGAEGADGSDVVSYESEIKAILDRACVSCHAEGASRAQSPMATFAEAEAVATGIVAKVISGAMPPGGTGLETDERELFSAWKDAGYPEVDEDAGGETDGGAADGATTAGGDAGGDGDPVTYEGVVKELLENACTGCHAPGQSRAQTPMVTYSDVRGLQDAIVSRVANGTMPPGSGLSAEKKSQFQAWKDADFPRGSPGGGDAGEATYEGRIKEILASQCVSCHKVGGSRAQTPMSNATEVGYIRFSIVKRITAGTMPPAGALSQAQQDLFNEWQENDYP